MKTLQTLLFALLLLSGNFARAQHKAPKERANNQAKRLTEKLGLSAEQEKKVYAIALQNAQQQDADRAKYQDNREDMINACKQNMDNYDAGLAKILTTDQLTKYNQLKAERRAHQGGGLGGGHYGGG